MKRHITILQKRLIILSLTLFFQNLAISQSETWKEYYSNTEARIDYKTTICDFSSTASQEIIVFRYTNLSNSDLIITYTSKVSYKDSQENTEQNLDEFRKTIKISEGEIIETNCESNWNEYNIFRGFVENKTGETYIYLTEFNLENLKIENE